MGGDELDEVVNEFLTESQENLDQLDQGLVELEQNPDPDVIARIFRTIHTIKGTSGFLGFTHLEGVTHVGESLLSKLRDGDLRVTQEITSALLAMVDAVREILDRVATTRTEGDEAYPDLVERLGRLVAAPAAAAPAPAPAPAPEPVVDEPAVAPVFALADVGAPAAEAPVAAKAPRARRGGKPKQAKQVAPEAPAAEANEGTPKADKRQLKVRGHHHDAQIVASEAGMFGRILLDSGKVEPEHIAEALDEQHHGDPRTVGELLVEKQVITGSDVVETLQKQEELRPATAETIRVDVRLLDDLMNLVGELVLARNQILQFTQNYGDASLSVTSQRLNLITSELQEGVMKTRMQPIENVWNKFPRVVRDLTLAVGKQARLEMEGRNTEVDKTLLEAIKDPLTHLVRNSIDHGLETPVERMAKGKPAEGVVSLRAYHEGGQVIIEISDDGAGIDPNVLRRKAVQKGMMTADEAAARSDREMVNIIFAAGFSTAEKVSNISGRGVGMDVVKTNIESIGGTVDVQTAIGKGTTIKVKIPLTLAIIPALLVTAGEGRYAIPQVSLLELVRLDGEQMAAGIEHVQGAPVYRLRGRLLPLVFLNEVFHTAPSSVDAVNIVVVQADDCTFGLVVDEISDTAEIVVKPLGRLLKNASGFAGATIMGDGRVALILDLPGVAALSGLNTTSAARSQSAAGAGGAAGSEQESILVVGIGERRFALPLARVARLEEFPAGLVRWAGDQRVVHYRDQILPLVFVGERLGIASQSDPDTPLQALVCGTGDTSVGLVVDSIHDIFDESLQYTDRTTAYGVRGTTVLHGEVTDVLDLDVLVPADVTLRLEVAAA